MFLIVLDIQIATAMSSFFPRNILSLFYFLKYFRYGRNSKTRHHGSIERDKHWPKSCWGYIWLKFSQTISFVDFTSNGSRNSVECGWRRICWNFKKDCSRITWKKWSSVYRSWHNSNKHSTVWSFANIGYHYRSSRKHR